MAQDWTIRQANGDDISFIYATWLNSFREDSDRGYECRKSIFFAEYNLVADRILEDLNTEILVACSPENQNVIFGYLVYEPGIIHYAYVKELFRKLGIARSLFIAAETPKVITHKTRTIKPILRKHDEIIYNPFILYKKKEVLNG